MKCETRLEKLERTMHSPEPIHIIIHLVSPERGVVSALDRKTQTYFHREPNESEEAFKARVDLATSV